MFQESQSDSSAVDLPNEFIFQPPNQVALRPSLGIITATDAATVTVEIAFATGGGFEQIDAVAVGSPAAYAANDKVIVVFQSEDTDSAIVVGKLSDYQYLLASEYTAADVLTKVKSVDGASSGLDADLLDGNEAAAFPKLATANTFTGIQTMPAIITNSGNEWDLGDYSATTITPTGLIEVVIDGNTYQIPAKAI